MLYVCVKFIKNLNAIQDRSVVNENRLLIEKKS